MTTRAIAFEDVKPGEHFVSVTKGMRGFFAVEYWINNQEPDIGNFVEPWQSDVCSFETREEAVERAKQYADELNLPHIL